MIRERIRLAHVEDGGVAIDPDLVVEALQDSQRVPGSPFLAHALGAVEDVAPADQSLAVPFSRMRQRGASSPMRPVGDRP
jgi:hypothetical protein